MVSKKEHLTTEGLNLILSIKAVMNGNGLSDKLQKSFKNETDYYRYSMKWLLYGLN